MIEILIGFGIWYACGCMFVGFGIDCNDGYIRYSNRKEI